jgi:predicted DCC family thiol-disulfide oxidoreductase YuxK
MKSFEKINIYYDNTCPMCTAFADNISKKDSDQILNKVSSSEKTTSIPKDDLLNEIHLIEQDGTIRKGADAILTSLAKIYPWLKPLMYAVRLPVLSWIASQCYFFIARRRKLWYGGDSARLYWLFLVTIIGMLAGILVSLPAWLDIRSYPTVGIFEQMNLLTPLTNVLTFLTISLLFISIFVYRNIRWFCLSILIIVVLLTLLDITRLQPWIFHYSALLLLLIFWKPDSQNISLKILDAARILVASIYFWSGFQKLNTIFFIGVFPWFTEPLWSPFGQTGASISVAVGLLVPFIEMGFALGLLTKKFRRLSIWGSLIMLILVITSLAFGHGWNSSIWPWNLAIFSMVIVLFYNWHDSLFSLINRSYKNTLAIIIFVVFSIMPAGNIFGYIDHYLSWSLYSGHVPTAFLTANIETLNKISSVKPTTMTEGELGQLDLLDWSIGEMNLVPYPEERVFKSIFKQVCDKYPEDLNLSLTITTRPFFESHLASDKSYNCSDLP